MSSFTAQCFIKGRWENDEYVDFQVNTIVIKSTISFQELVGVGSQLYGNAYLKDLRLWLFIRTEERLRYQELVDEKDVAWFLNIMLFSDGLSISLILHSAVESFEPSIDSGEGMSRTCAVSQNRVVRMDTMNAITDDVSLVDEARHMDGGSLKINDLFIDKSLLKKSLHFYAIRNNFHFRTIRSNAIRFEVACIVEDCGWKLNARKLRGSNMWLIRRFINFHSCSMSLVTDEHPHVNPDIISEYVSDLFASCKNMYSIKPNDIIRHMRLNHGVNVSYLKAWKAREFVIQKIHGSATKSYQMIPWFSHIMVQKNPGSVVEWLLDDEERFKYLFLAIHASIVGWPSCRPVISVDGTFLQNKFGGTLLVASTVDANNQIFPLAFAVVDSENDESWGWFFRKLKSAFQLGESFSIISDRHKSIIKAVTQVFPRVNHNICMYHLASNLSNKFKKKGLGQLFMRCAKAYNVVECEKYLCIMEGISPRVKQYLLDVGLSKWARAHCKGLRYNIMTTNTAESFNARIRDARKLPVLAMLLEFRTILQQWFFERRTTCNAMATELSTWAEKQVRDQIDKAGPLQVRFIDTRRCEVIDVHSSFVVDLTLKTCGCRKWDLDGIPCAHACACLKKLNVSPVRYTSKYFRKDMLVSTYSSVVHPIGDIKDWDIPVEVKNIVVRPPVVKRPAGRPRIARIQHPAECRKKMRCGRCGLYGHNRKTCRNAILPH